MRFIPVHAVLALFIASTVSALAANTASDNAADAAYSDGWQDGDNGGTGFGAWVIQPAGNSSTEGHFVGDSNGNGGAGGPGINSSGAAWGMYANGGSQVNAYRPLTGGALGVGQTLVFEMDNGFIDSPGATFPTVGITLQSSVGHTIWEFYFRGGDATYTVAGATSGNDCTLPFTDGGVRVEFTLTGATTYDARITVLATSQQQLFTNDDLLNFGNTSIERLRVYNFNAGSTGARDAFFNKVSVVPEPSTWAMIGAGLVGILFRRQVRR